MPKEIRLADGVLDLGLVKLVNLGIDPDKSVEPLINAWEYIHSSDNKGALRL